jgi:hypothetical protein
MNWEGMSSLLDAASSGDSATVKNLLGKETGDIEAKNKVRVSIHVEYVCLTCRRSRIHASLSGLTPRTGRMRFTLLPRTATATASPC